MAGVSREPEYREAMARTDGSVRAVAEWMGVTEATARAALWRYGIRLPTADRTDAEVRAAWEAGDGTVGDVQRRLGYKGRKHTRHRLRRLGLPVTRGATLDKYERDLEMHRLVGAGWTQRAVAERLGVSETTVSRVLAGER